jgi:hypothetical protein
MSLVDLEMLKLVQSPMKKVELYGRGEMATMESWVEVGTQVSSNSFVLAIECVSYDAGVERRELALNMRARPNKFT